MLILLLDHKKLQHIISCQLRCKKQDYGHGRKLLLKRIKSLLGGPVDAHGTLEEKKVSESHIIILYNELDIRLRGFTSSVASRLIALRT